MANTTHVSLRLPCNLVDAVDAQARATERSRAKVIEMCLRGTYGHSGTDEQHAGAAVERSGNGAAVSVLQEAEGAEKRLHPVQSVRDELAAFRNACTSVLTSFRASRTISFFITVAKFGI